MSPHDTDRTDQIGRLIRLGGKRPAPDPERLARARAAARDEWMRTIRVRSRWRWFARTSGAVVAAAAVALLWLWEQDPPPAPERIEVATLYAASGPVTIGDSADPGHVRRATGADRILTGDRVIVGDVARAGFVLDGGISLRLNAATEVVFTLADRIELRRGTLYVDADPSHPRRTVSVDTPFGTVSHVGTQFEVRLQPRAMEVRVREGEVVVAAGRTKIASRAGEAVVLSEGSPPERRRIETSGVEWEWVASLARPFTLEGSTVAPFLEWATREQGWRWEYGDNEARRIAERTILHGSVEGLTPAEAIAAVLPSANLSWTRDGNRLIVHSNRGR